MNSKLFFILIFPYLTVYGVQNQTEQQDKWAKASKKYNCLAFSINFFDIDKVNEYALQLKKQCPDWLTKSNSKNFSAGCEHTISEQAYWSRALESQGYPVQKFDENIEVVLVWACFCNAHGSPSKELVEEYIAKGDSEGLAKAINYIQMSKELCVQPKEYAQNTDVTTEKN